MPNIALVDDDPELLALLQMILSPHYEVATYGSGEAALSAFSDVRPDAVLLDIDLGPDVMNGTLVIKRFQELGYEMPVIAVTSRNRESERDMLIAMGFADHIAKPFADEGVLLSAIQDCIDGERASVLGGDE